MGLKALKYESKPHAEPLFVRVFASARKKLAIKVNNFLTMLVTKCS